MILFSFEYYNVNLFFKIRKAINIYFILNINYYLNITNLSQYISISKGYCRLNSIIGDVTGVAVASSVVAVHPEVSVIRTAMLSCCQ